MQEVNWDDVNLLELGVLLDMAKDGYFFQLRMDASDPL